MPTLAEMTFTEARGLDLPRIVALLPVGATEAHGPHLPLSTDVVIAEAMAHAAVAPLAEAGLVGLVLPPVCYSVTRYAGAFPGTIGISPATATAIVVDVARALAGHGVKMLGIANAHLEPAHIESLQAAVDTMRHEQLLAVAFPDVTRKPWALRLTDELKSGACHAGRYEGSIVMAARPELVREEVQRTLAPNAASLSRAIRDGKTTFEEAGGPEAYFGDPAAATAAEGRQTITILGAILAEAVLAARPTAAP